MFERIETYLKGSDFIVRRLPIPSNQYNDLVIKIIWTGWQMDLTVVTIREKRVTYKTIENEILSGVNKDVYDELLSLLQPLFRDEKINDILTNI